MGPMVLASFRAARLSATLRFPIPSRAPAMETWTIRTSFGKDLRMCSMRSRKKASSGAVFFQDLDTS